MNNSSKEAHEDSGRQPLQTPTIPIEVPKQCAYQFLDDMFSALRSEILYRMSKQNELLIYTLAAFTSIAVFTISTQTGFVTELLKASIEGKPVNIPESIESVIPVDVILVYPILVPFLTILWFEHYFAIIKTGEFIKVKIEKVFLHALENQQGWEEYVQETRGTFDLGSRSTARFIFIGTQILAILLFLWVYIGIEKSLGHGLDHAFRELCDIRAFDSIMILVDIFAIALTICFSFFWEPNKQINQKTTQSEVSNDKN